MERLRTLGVGAGAGAAATLVMSGAMIAAERLGLMGRMPPEEISKRAVERVQGSEDAPRQVVDLLAPVAHVGFGMAAGSLFALLSRRGRAPLSPVLQGVVFGVGVWLVSYFGWLPALRLMPPAQRDEPGRQPAMLAAHLVYGAVLGGLAGRRD
ncbi:MAG: DUF1440 domain-containing protein [Chloroflexota bacterium]|nr:DUF1440 domain-containing protein [Chloroflexota bacterium]